MGLAKERLSQERSIHLKNLVIGAMLVGIGGFGSVGTLRDGIGESTSGKGALLHKGIDALTSRGLITPRQVEILLSLVFLVLAIYGLVVLLRSLRRMSAKNTHLGQSIMTQAQPGETLKELIKEIDDDLEREHISYGPIHVGSRWLLVEQAMRLNRIIGIYTADAGLRGVALALVDKDKNIQYVGLSSFKGEKIEDAAMGLHSLCPGAEMGGIKELMNLTEPGWDSNVEPEIEIATGQLQTNGGLTLSRKGCIPTSCFDRALLSEALKGMEVGEELSITLLEPTKPSKYVSTEALLARRMGDREWELAVAYMEFGDEPCEAVYATDVGGVLEAMTVLNEQKLLPDFSMWEQRKLKGVKKEKAKA